MLNAAVSGSSLGISTKMMMDTGANKIHVFNDYGAFHNVRPAPEGLSIEFGGNKGTPEFVGDVIILTDYGYTVTLTDVAFWPRCPANLVSFNRTLNAGHTNKSPQSLQDSWVFSKNGNTIFTCEPGPTQFWELGARPLRLASSAADRDLAASAGIAVSSLVAGAERKLQITADMVHRSFAHMGGDSALALAIDTGMVEGVPIRGADLNAATEEERCASCITGKHMRLSFKPSITEAARKVQVIHIDIQGPLPVSLDGHKYWISFLDDYSGVAAVRLLKHRSDAPAMVKETLALLEGVGKSAVEVLRSDGGGEYFANAVEGWLKEKGIIHNSSLPYSPQQNGKAERLNLTLMNSVRASLADLPAEFQEPKRLWDEALICALRAYNSLPKAGYKKTPWELFTGSRPDASLMRPFGALCYVHIQAAQRGPGSKADQRAALGRFMSYPPRRKGYRVMLQSDGRVVESRDVTWLPGYPTKLGSSKLELHPSAMLQLPEKVTFDASGSEWGGGRRPPYQFAWGHGAGHGAGHAGSGERGAWRGRTPRCRRQRSC